MREQSERSIQYISKIFAKEDEHLLAIKNKLKEDKKIGINISPHEGRLLQLLLKLVNAKKVVEVGTLYGYSALWMARALPEGGKLFTFESNEEHANQSKFFIEKLPESQKIEFFVGLASEELKKITEPVDVFFIDADKASYLIYLDFAEKLVRKGGLIIGDNTFLFGHMYGQGLKKISEKKISIMGEFNKRLSDSSRYESVIIPTFEGMTVALKKY